MAKLERLAAKYGTDKLKHGYIPHYSEYLWLYRPEKVLEIGVAEGRSLRMWRDYWPAAKIVGIDINPECSKLEIGENVTILIGDQTDAAFMRTVSCEYGPFDIVIDDGGHVRQRETFEVLWPEMPSGSWYVIEDLHAYYGRRARRYGKHDDPGGTMSWLSSLILNRVEEAGIAGMHVHRSIVFMEKS